MYYLNVIELDWPAIAGSGFVVSILMLALVERLRRTFATRQEVDGLAKRLSALQSLYLQAREAANQAREQALAVGTEQRHQAERIAEQVIRPLGRIAEKLESLSEAQIVQASTLDQVCKRLDQAESVRPLRRVQARRRT